MRILVLSFYFRPDLSAGSFRTTALVEALRGKMSGGGHIEVLTTLPNRYSSFQVEAPVEETEAGLHIVRIALPQHRSGLLDQAQAYLAFARTVLRKTRHQEYDLVFATSSRLMTAALGALIARRKRIPLYLDLRDIFVDTIKDVLPRPFALLARPGFALIERWTMSRADRVNLVSRGFATYFNPRYPDRHFSYFSNGIDDEFLNAFLQPHGAHAPAAVVKVLYAGNVGEGQGLHLIVPELAMRMRGKVHFTIIGDGGRKEALRIALADAGVDNVELLPPMGRARLIEAYREADVLFLHLNNYAAFDRVLPSKLFEYGATGKPIWAGVSGHAAEFVRTELDNAVLFPPCDVGSAVNVFARLRLCDVPRERFVAKYARTKIVGEMADDILELGDGRK